jgi:hypothetical protein
MGASVCPNGVREYSTRGGTSAKTFHRDRSLCRVSHAEIAQAFSKISGITVSLLPGEQKQVVTKTRARNHQLALLVWDADYFDPHQMLGHFARTRMTVMRAPSRRLPGGVTFKTQN